MSFTAKGMDLDCHTQLKKYYMIFLLQAESKNKLYKLIYLQNRKRMIAIGKEFMAIREEGWKERIVMDCRIDTYVLVSQSCPTLCDPVDYSPPGSSVHGIFQASILERFAISFSNWHVYTAVFKTDSQQSLTIITQWTLLNII